MTDGEKQTIKESENKDEAGEKSNMPIILFWTFFLVICNVIIMVLVRYLLKSS